MKMEVQNERGTLTWILKSQKHSANHSEPVKKKLSCESEDFNVKSDSRDPLTPFAAQLSENPLPRIVPLAEDTHRPQFGGCDTSNAALRGPRREVYRSMALETLGGVCAVGQLMGQCIYVLEIVEKVRRSTETLKGYQTQLEGLRVLCEVIKGNPSLQTTEVISHAQSILETTEKHEDLAHLLQKRRIHRVWTFLRVERRLVEHSKNIESLKSTLLISIQDQQCRILHNIDMSTQKTARSNQKVKRQRDDGRAPEGSAGRRGGPRYDGVRSDMEVALAGPYGGEISPREVPGISHYSQTQSSENSLEQSLADLEMVRSRLGGDAAVWLDNTASADVNQQNGNSLARGTSHSNLYVGAKAWVQNKKYGRGTQHNGPNIADGVDGHLSGQDIRGSAWIRNGHTNDQNGRHHTQGRHTAGATQQNGVDYGSGAGHRSHREGHYRRQQ